MEPIQWAEAVPGLVVGLLGVAVGFGIVVFGLLSYTAKLTTRVARLERGAEKLRRRTWILRDHPGEIDTEWPDHLLDDWGDDLDDHDCNC